MNCAVISAISIITSIGQYFDSQLRGDTVEAPGFSIEADGIADASRLVWEQWQLANRRLDEPRLAAPQGSWPTTGGDMKYLFMRKGEEMPENGLPLYIFLHGSGPNDYEFAVGADWCTKFDDSPSMYFIPRSPQGGSGCRWYQPSRQIAWERLLRQAFLSDSIDANRVYMLGISEGGYGSQRLASFYPDYLAGAGPIAGGEPTYNCDPANTATMAYCQQTGENDFMFGRSIIVGRAKEHWDSLAAAHPGYYAHKIDLQPGRGHGCDYTLTTPWLKQYRRNPCPAYFYWERQAIGNVNGEGARARRSAYNIVVEEGLNGASDSLRRDAYEMTVDGNTINLRILDVTITPCAEVTVHGWTMNSEARRTAVPARSGRVRIYLDNRIVDLSKPVTVKVNGRRRFHGRVALDGRNMLESVAEFFDPERIFPASVTVSVH